MQFFPAAALALEVNVRRGSWQDLPEGISLLKDTHEFVIGDVHGYYREFRKLVQVMSLNARGGSMALNARGGSMVAHLTMLGDLVDRGPQGLACMRLASSKADVLGFLGTTMLMGNHEALMLGAMSMVGRDREQEEMAELWLGNGGTALYDEAEDDPRIMETMQPWTSYPREYSDCAPWMRLLLGADMMKWVQGMGTHRELPAADGRAEGGVLLTHAGTNRAYPDLVKWFSTPLWPVMKEDDHWAWVRDACVNSKEPCEGRLLIHGHTPENRTARAQGFRQRAMGSPLLLHVPQGLRLCVDGGTFSTGFIAGCELREMDGRARMRTWVSGSRQAWKNQEDKEQMMMQ